MVIYPFPLPSHSILLYSPAFIPLTPPFLLLAFSNGRPTSFVEHVSWHR